MSVFNVSGEIPANLSTGTTASGSQVTDPLPGGSETSAGTETGGVETGTTTGQSAGSEGQSPETIQIVLDGPLSRIYTNALNLVYANEGAEVDTSIVFKEAADADAGVSEDENTDALYVYCCRSDEGDASEVSRVTKHLRLALDGKRYRGAVVCIESGNSVKAHIGLLESFSHDIGVDVYHTRGNALEAVLARFK